MNRYSRGPLSRGLSRFVYILYLHHRRYFMFSIARHNFYAAARVGGECLCWLSVRAHAVRGEVVAGWCAHALARSMVPPLLRCCVSSVRGVAPILPSLTALISVFISPVLSPPRLLRTPVIQY